MHHFRFIDTCQGDSGGPLMAFTASNQWVLVGATSNGIGCANPNYAGIYTRIANYQSWINSTTSGSYSTSTSLSLTSATTEIDLSAKCSAHIHHVSRVVSIVALVIFVLHETINLI
jgi:secreted trypsin-like serine protease